VADFSWTQGLLLIIAGTYGWQKLPCLEMKGECAAALNVLMVALCCMMSGKLVRQSGTSHDHPRPAGTDWGAKPAQPAAAGLTGLLNQKGDFGLGHL
jgi:hypothetical protein